MTRADLEPDDLRARDRQVRSLRRSDRHQADRGVSGEALFFGLAIDDLTRAADVFRPSFDASGGFDGWVSLKISPLLADDSSKTIATAVRLQARAARPNLFIIISGTPAGIAAIEESIFAGVPINVTLLFSCPQYVAAADAGRFRAWPARAHAQPEQPEQPEHQRGR